MTLYDDVISFLERYGKTESDIVWIGTTTSNSIEKPFKISLQNFKEVAMSESVDDEDCIYWANDILVVGNNWWLERLECEGERTWEFKTLPKEPKSTFKIEKLTHRGYNCFLRRINDITTINDIYGKITIADIDFLENIADTSEETYENLERLLINLCQSFKQ